MDSPDSLVSEGFGFVGELGTWDVDGDFSLTVPIPFARIHSRRRGDHVIVQGRVGLQIKDFDEQEIVCFNFFVFPTTSWLKNQRGTDRTSWKVVPGRAACKTL